MKKSLKVVALIGIAACLLFTFNCPTPPPPTAPAAPGAPNLAPGSGQISVSWSSVSGATSYSVFFNTTENSGSAAQFGGDIAGMSTTITSLGTSTLYYVWLKAKNATGTSPFSQPCLTTTRPAGLPFEALGGGVSADVSRFNGANIYHLFAPQPAAKPESNLAPSTTYSYTFTTTAGAGTPVVTAKSLAFNTWTAGSITAGEVKWYYFNATNGAVHNINWDDSYSGSGTYTCDIKVTAYRQNLTTTYFTDIDSAYTSPRTITAAATEKVFLRVEGYVSSYAGTFAIKDSPTGTPSFGSPAGPDDSLEKTGEDAAQDGNSDTGGELVFSSKQTDCDLFMRNAENQALASRAPQFSKIPSGIDAAPPAGPVVGTAWNNVYIVVTGNTISTTCRAVSNRAYFFVDNRDTSAMSSYLAAYCTTFDAIYDVNHSRFGFENDTDGNGKVIIVFSRELTGGLLGYFYAVDKYPKTTYSDSNEADVFYMTTDTSYQGAIVNGTLAHEFQHMIYFDEHYDRGVTSTFSWLNEALSQVAEYYNNYTANHHAWIASFLNNGWAGLSLTHWTSSNYGYGAVWIRYIRDRFGNTAIGNMCATNLVGIAAVEAATGTDFNTLFNDFTRALVMSGTGDSTDPNYNFTTLNLQTVQPSGRGGLTTTISNAADYDFSGSFYAYRIHFARWTGYFGTMNLSGTGVPGTSFGLSR